LLLFDRMELSRINRAEIHRIVYLSGLLLIAAFLPFSVYITSVAHFLLIANYLIEGNYYQKYKTLTARISILIFLLLISVHFIWLFNTVDFKYAFNDIRIKLPLLALPIIIGTTASIKFKQLKIILLVFSGAILLNTIISTFSLTGVIENNSVHDTRDISLFVSHIRLSLMIVLSVFILLWFMVRQKIKYRFEYYLYSIVVIWLVVFLIISQFFTGIVLFSIAVTLFLFWVFSKFKHRKIKIISIAFLFAVIFSMLAVGYYQVRSFYSPPIRSGSQLLKTTENGNPYYHNTSSKVVENGNLIYVEICEPELRRAWELRSPLCIDSLDSQKQPVFHTLVRYLSSKGLPKDAKSVLSLSDLEIMAIEDSKTNVRYLDGVDFFDRIYQFIWQIDYYLKEGNPSGHSLTQRIEYVKTGFYILGKNYFIGVGTGDVGLAFKQSYIELNTMLEEQFRHRAHNQILTFYISFGCIGASICLIAIFFPLILEPKRSRYLMGLFILIAMLSMVNEDTLETATGAAFFAYFYSLFLWGSNE